MSISASKSKKPFWRRLFNAAALAGALGVSAMGGAAHAMQEDRWRGLQDEAVLVVGQAGEIYHDQRGDEQVVPASTVKLMTLYMLMEAIDEGLIGLEDEIVMSPRAASIPRGYRQTNIAAWERFTVDYALRAMFVYSANDVASSTGAHLAKLRTDEWAEARFVELMNERAAELGMVNTVFHDASGMSGESRTTPRDMIILAQAMTRDFPQLFDGDPEFADYPAQQYFERRTRRNTNGMVLECPCTVAPNAYAQAQLEEQGSSGPNELVEGQEGLEAETEESLVAFKVDGLKTGFTIRAGFSVIASSIAYDAETNEPYRIYASYFGGTDDDIRDERVLERLSDAYEQYYGQRVLMAAAQQPAPRFFSDSNADYLTTLRGQRSVGPN